MTGNAGFNYLQSSDAGAPILTCEAGSLIALLDACLVNGYGSQVPLGWTKQFRPLAYENTTVSFASGSGTTTTSFNIGFVNPNAGNTTTNFFSGTVPQGAISGCAIKMTSGAANGNIRYCTAYAQATRLATVSPAFLTTPTTGDTYITMATTSVYVNNVTTGGTGYMFKVDTDDQINGNIWVYAYNPNGMPNVAYGNTLIGVAQGSFIWTKDNASATAELQANTPRQWFMVGDNYRFWLFVNPGFSSWPQSWYSYYCGDIFSYDAAWANRFCFGGIAATRTTTNTPQTVGQQGLQINSGAALGAAGALGIQVATKYTGGATYSQPQMLTSQMLMFLSGAGPSAINPGGPVAGVVYPNVPNNSLILEPCYIYQLAPNMLLGSIPGIWVDPHSNLGGNDGDTFTASSGNLNGKSFRRVNMVDGTGNHIWIETSNTWAVVY